MKNIDLIKLCKDVKVVGEKGRFTFPLKYKNFGKKVKFWYETNFGYKPMPVTLTRFIPLNESTLSAFGLIQAEASKSLNQGYFQFNNTSPELIRFILTYFKKFWNMPKQNWKYRITYARDKLNENTKNEIINFWSNFLHIEKNIIKVYNSSKISRGASRYGSMYIVVHNKIFKTVVLEFLEKIIKPFVENSKMSGYYLRGIMSGDGTLNTYRNLVCHIGIAFNYNSNELTHYKKVLDNVNIKALYLKGFIQISHWENYFKILRMTNFKPFIQRDKNLRFLKALKNNVKTLLRLYKLVKCKKISTKHYSKLFGISPRGSRKNLGRMIKLGLLERYKVGRKHFYCLTSKGQETLNVIKYLIEKVGDKNN